ncbi:MAG: CBS domain-containing protein [Gammaproteobacteria bacterium]|nr:CBS domain-containing protein [Gammaproteobacteria bacterium]MDH5614274.1 CBS domain-containing protein [Gammaproteobacteria bacterium]
MSDYVPLPLHHLPLTVSYCRPTQDVPQYLKKSDEARLAMTDLRQVTAITIEPNASIDHAMLRMKEASIHMLLVTNPKNEVLGLITTTDIQGEKPMQVVLNQGASRDDIMVRAIMTPRDHLEVMKMADVEKAYVGDIVETLIRSGRRHALVIDEHKDNQQESIRGIFSQIQLSQQLGEQIESVEIAKTFAEVEKILG